MMTMNEPKSACGAFGYRDPHREARKPMGDRDYFTLVFKGDITKFKGSPLKTETPFGVPVAAGLGDAFQKLENIFEIEDAAQKLIAAIARIDNDADDAVGQKRSPND
jgi:hypothetical protein